MYAKILTQYKAMEEAESTRAGATQEDKAHAVAQVLYKLHVSLILHVRD
jgi:hypothetical protein